MKHIILLSISLIMTYDCMSQEFEYRPDRQELRFEGTTGDAAVEFKIFEDQANYEYARLTVRDEESHPYIDLTYDQGGKIILNQFEGNFQSELTKEAFRLLSKGNQRYSFTINSGLQTFDDNGSMTYQITESNGFRAYNNNGQVSVQIRGDVGGDGRVSTDELEIMGGSDLSENFDIIDSESEIRPGLIVSIKGENGKLTISKEKRDKKVVGIVSGAHGIKTGLLMGQKGSIADGDYPIALTGRTYVYTTTENGPIKPGDFITTSSTPGYGMRVKNHKKARGAIIGKAMTSLSAESGLVLVLVNLQ